MLLRRVIEHVRTQNWTAVALDFVIVVVGVFIGIQVDGWNSARLDRVTEIRYLERLSHDLDKDVDGLERALATQIRRQEQAQLILAALDDEAIVRSDPSAFVSAIQYAGYTYMPGIFDHTFEEMKSSGLLPLIKDEVLRAEIGAYYTLVEQSSQWEYLRIFSQENYIERSLGILTPGQHRMLTNYNADGAPTFSEAEAMAALDRLKQKPEFIEWLPMTDTGYHRANILTGLFKAAQEVRSNINDKLGTDTKA